MTDGDPLLKRDLSASISVELGDDGLSKVLSLRRVTSKALSDRAHLGQDGLNLSLVQLSRTISVVGSKEDSELLVSRSLRNEGQTSSKLLEVDLSAAILIESGEESLEIVKNYKHTLVARLPARLLQID